MGLKLCVLLIFYIGSADAAFQAASLCLSRVPVVGYIMYSPFDSVPANYRGGWEPEQTRRGTWDILSSCMATMILCVWIAIHLNIPAPDTKLNHILRRAG